MTQKMQISVFGLEYHIFLSISAQSFQIINIGYDYQFLGYW